MDFSHIRTVEECDSSIQTFRACSMPIPPELLELREKLADLSKVKDNIAKSDTPIWDTLKVNYPYGIMPDKKIKCVEETVEQLLSEEPNATEPCLLLGKIQCGKTDTFEDIIGLCFDKGFDVAIVLQKGTVALLNQTVSRMKRDYRFFKPTDDMDNVGIQIHDVHNIKHGLKRALVDRNKTVIVAMKQKDNLKIIIDLLTNPKKSSTYLKDKRILIVDDEADFASINYRNIRASPIYDEDGNIIPQDVETEKAKIAAQIDEIRNIIGRNCRYLQVTATPYCLYLQPNGELYLNGQYVQSFRPRFTSIVPIHSKYIGGDHYFIKSKDPESMYSHLFCPVEPECLERMKHEHRTVLNNGSGSQKMYGLTYALVSYLMATAIRSIQRRKEENKKYTSSAVVHVEVDKDNHDWQLRLIQRLVEDIEKYVVEGQSLNNIEKAIDISYEDFKVSSKKATEQGLINSEFPTKDEIIEEIKIIFKTHNINVQLVNSDAPVNALLDDDSGELKIEHIANIFIGGNILDRGITIKNMLCFFYGRMPKQQDTVLQHARFYGSRDLEDMAVTRLHTSNKTYSVLERMNTIDNQLRDWFIDGKDKSEPNAVFIGFDKDFKPCAKSKIKVSDTLLIKGQSRILPVGFWTGSRKEIDHIVKTIDKLITSSPNYGKQTPDGFFEMDVEEAMKILELVRQTYVYEKEHENVDHKSDMLELMCALEYCANMSDGKIYVLHRQNRNMNRLRSDNHGFIDAPDDGKSDLAPSREIAKERPVLMLLRQNGKKNFKDGKNYGWDNAEFYWPVLLPQENLKTVMYAIDTKGKGKSALVDLDKFLYPIKKEDVLSLTFTGDMSFFGEEGTEYDDWEKAPVETRGIKKSTAARYILKDKKGDFALAPDVKELNAGVYSRNNGKFPFVLKPWKYMLLRNGRSSNSTLMLLELANPALWHTEYKIYLDNEGGLLDAYPPDTPIDKHKVLMYATDVIETADKKKLTVTDRDICQWIVCYRVKKVLKYQEKTILLDEEIFDEED